MYSTQLRLLGRLRQSFIVRQVQGGSMLPSLRTGQLVVAKRTYRVKPGDVVIVRHAGLEKIKRIKERQEDRLYLLGDNPAASTDSRTFGWIPVECVIAKVVWPKV